MFIRQINIMLGIGLLLVAGCAPQESTRVITEEKPTSAQEREARKLFSGAPPIIPHKVQTASCTSCHTQEGKVLPGMGIASANPHLKTAHMNQFSRCDQCHVYQKTENLFVENSFVGMRRLGEKGDRLHSKAPPAMPHPVFMREDCASCHTGVSARPEIRCSHPERTRCQQCHLARGSEQAPEMFESLLKEFAANNQKSPE